MTVTPTGSGGIGLVAGEDVGHKSGVEVGSGTEGVEGSLQRYGAMVQE